MFTIAPTLDELRKQVKDALLSEGVPDGTFKVSGFNQPELLPPFVFATIISDSVIGSLKAGMNLAFTWMQGTPRGEPGFCAYDATEGYWISGLSSVSHGVGHTVKEAAQKLLMVLEAESAAEVMKKTG